MAQQSENRPTRRKEIVHTLLYVALVVFLVLAALQGRKAWQGWKEREQAANKPTNPDGKADSSPAGMDIKSVMSGKGPLELGGLREVKTDPGGIAPPAEAKPLHSFVRTAMGKEDQVARYESGLDMPAVAEHYKKAFASAGYKLLSDRTVEGRRGMVLASGETNATLMLEKKMPSGDAVTIVLVVTCPAGATASAPATEPK